MASPPRNGHGVDRGPELPGLVEVDGLLDAAAEALVDQRVPLGQHGADERQPHARPGGGEQVGERVRQADAPDDLRRGRVDDGHEIERRGVGRAQPGRDGEEEGDEADQPRDEDDRLEPAAEPEHRGWCIRNDRRDLDEHGDRRGGVLEEPGPRHHRAPQQRDRRAPPGSRAGPPWPSPGCCASRSRAGRTARPGSSTAAAARTSGRRRPGRAAPRAPKNTTSPMTGATNRPTRAHVVVMAVPRRGGGGAGPSRERRTRPSPPAPAGEGGAARWSRRRRPVPAGPVITTTRSDSITASAIEWVTNTTVTWRCSHRRRRR